MVDTNISQDILEPGEIASGCSNDLSKKERRKIEHFWSKKEVYQLIDYVKNSPDLWDISRSNRSIPKQKVLGKIAAAMNLNSSDVTSKWHNIRTQYCRELRNVLKTKSGSGRSESYVPRWEFFKSLRFLQSKNVKTTQLKREAQTHSDGNTNGNTAPEENDADTTYIDLVSDRRSQSQRKIDSRTRISRKRFNNIHDDHRTLRTVWKRKAMEKGEDKFDIFGKFIAGELRALARLDQYKAKREMQQVILKYEPVAFTNQRTAISPTTTSTTSSIEDFDDTHFDTIFIKEEINDN